MIKKRLIISVLLSCVLLCGCSSVVNVISDKAQEIVEEVSEETLNDTTQNSYEIDGEESFAEVYGVKIPEYSGNPYYEVNGNNPFFTDDEIIDKSFEKYGELDELGRCTTAIACLSLDTMPGENEERGTIGQVKPSGWHSVKYDCIEGKYAMNRCHMVGWQLGNENGLPTNLVSGSRYMNLEMLETENEVADYIRASGNHVMYRINPVFKGSELLCRGLLMEGYSVEDEGEGINFCLFYYNVQPGISFDYQTGESEYTGVFLDTDSPAVNIEVTKNDQNQENVTAEEVSPLPEDGQEVTYVLNRSSMKFHLSDCSGVSKMSDKNKEVFEGNRDYLISIGYEPCGMCNP